MTRDPREGVDADGFLVTGASRASVPAPYEPVLADCARRLTAAFGDQLDGLYLYGSVATGQARPPESDLDLLALWTSTVDGALVASVAERLSTRHSTIVREVGLYHAPIAEALADEADRCFLKHYCVSVIGRDVRPSLGRCRPSRALADGFNGDLVRRLRSTVDSSEDLGVRARKVARSLLLAVATIESVAHATWSTDRGTGAVLLTQHHPEWTDVARNAVELTAGRGNPDAVEDLLTLASWLTGHP